MKNEKIKVSIIVPCYNAEKYIVKCVNSILSQKYKNIELICINDGSRDNTLNILKELHLKDSRMVVIDKTNGGVSSARNSGLQAASGEYILFVDSDDYISDEMVGTLLEKAILFSADIVKCNRFDVYDNGQIIERKPLWNKETIISKDDFSKEIYPEFFNRNKLCNIWMTLISHKIIKDNKIIFSEELTVNEDEFFSAQIFSVAKKFVYIPEPYYFYVKNTNGLSSNGANIYSRYESRKKHMELFSDLARKWNIVDYNNLITEKRAFIAIHTASQNAAWNCKYKKNEQFALFKQILKKDFYGDLKKSKGSIMLFPEKLLLYLVKCRLFHIAFWYARFFEMIKTKYRKNLEKYRKEK